MSKSEDIQLHNFLFLFLILILNKLFLMKERNFLHFVYLQVHLKNKIQGIKWIMKL